MAILICFDVENRDIFDETIAAKPSLILKCVGLRMINAPSLPESSPVWIPRAATSGGVAASSAWRIAMETMARKFESTLCSPIHHSSISDLCREHQCPLVRVDNTDGMGTSIAIDADMTVFSPSSGEVYMTVMLVHCQV